MTSAHDSNLQSPISLRFQHTPVLLAELVAGLLPQPGGRYVDATVGGGGHAAAILAASAPNGQLLGIDADPAAIDVAQARLAEFADRATVVNASFRDLAAIVDARAFGPVDGIVMDLGI